MNGIGEKREWREIPPLFLTREEVRAKKRECR